MGGCSSQNFACSPNSRHRTNRKPHAVTRYRHMHAYRVHQFPPPIAAVQRYIWTRLFVPCRSRGIIRCPAFVGESPTRCAPTGTYIRANPPTKEKSTPSDARRAPKRDTCISFVLRREVNPNRPLPLAHPTGRTRAKALYHVQSYPATAAVTLAFDTQRGGAVPSVDIRAF